MERRLKERVVGATLLVVAGVVFIPWLLDGRDPSQNVSQPLTLPAANGGAMKTKKIVLNAGQPTASEESPANETPSPRAAGPAASLPLPAAASEVAAKQAQTAQKSVPMPSAQPPPKTVAKPKPEVKVTQAPSAPVQTTPKPRPRPTNTTSGWAVQVGSFSSENNARRLADELVALSYKAFVSRKVIGQRVMYRVRVGPLPEREAAAALAQRLKADKQPISIVEHPG